MKNLLVLSLILVVAACGGGGGGGTLGPTLSPAQQANVATASSASLASSQSQASNTSISAAVSNLSELVSANAVLSSNSAVTASALAAQQAVVLASTAQNAASAAAADLLVASNVSIVGVVSAGRIICAADNSCTNAEISALSFRAAEKAKNAAEASLYAITATNQLKSLITSAAPTLNVSVATAAISTAQSSATSAQATANQAINNYLTSALETGATVTAVSPSTGTTGSVAGTPSYSGNTQTIVTTFGDGKTSTATNTATGTAVTWATDHVTKTITYTFANGGTNPVVSTVAGTAATPTYSGNTQTIVTTYGDGHTATATNTSTSAPVTWATDHVTKTITYTFANGGTNPVVSTVAGTISSPALTAAVYPSNWTTTGITVTAPAVSSVATTYGDGYVSTAQDGTSSKPFLQTTLAALSTPITDPNANISSSTTTYNLTWGTPDKNGPVYAASFPNASTKLSFNFSYAGVMVSGQGVVGPTVVQPSTDVLAAWRAGWTGKGTSILTIDGYTNRSTCAGSSQSTLGNCHGITTMMISDLVAVGATKYGLDYNYNASVITIGGTNITAPITPNVINMSYWQDSVQTTRHINYLTGATSYSNITLTGAVLVKSAGNTYGRDTYSTATGDYLVKGLVDNATTVNRLLIVGALDKTGSTASPATIATYSHFAGATVAASNRFVVANGRAPFANGGVSMNGSAIPGYESYVGTSFAAPVVSGYASVLMSKFPNLDAIKTSSIILDTARYDTLSCHPSCSAAIYGKGEASLSRALAPVGALR